MTDTVGDESQGEVLTLARAVARYLSRVRQRRAQATYETYRQAIKLFLALLKDDLKVNVWTTPVANLKREWLEYFLSHLQEHKSIETEHVYSRAILSFYKEVVNREWAVINVTALQDDLRHLRRRKGRRLPRFPQQELEMILDYAQTAPLPVVDEKKTPRKRLRSLRDRAFLFLLADTGLRVSEACGLQRGDVDLSEGQVRVIGKGDKEAIVRISNRVIRALRRYLQERATLDGQQAMRALAELPLFAQHAKRAGKRILPVSRWTGQQIVNAWTNIALDEKSKANLSAQGMSITPHSFRHYFVTTVLRGTGNLHTTQRLARHADPSTTTRYLHLTDEELDIAYHDIFNQ